MYSHLTGVRHFAKTAQERSLDNVVSKMCIFN